MSGFIPLISDLGKLGLHAAGLLLEDGWILVLESWMVSACAKHVGWDAAASGMQKTLESGTGDASSGLVGLKSWVELSVKWDSALILFAIALFFFLAELPTALFNLC